MCASASLRNLQPAMKTAPTGQDTPKRPKSHCSTTRARNRDAHFTPNLRHEITIASIESSEPLRHLLHRVDGRCCRRCTQKAKNLPKHATADAPTQNNRENRIATPTTKGYFVDFCIKLRI
jgi:hypothetical protein